MPVSDDDAFSGWADSSTAQQQAATNQRNANANMQAANGVPSTAAITAFQKGPAAGVPPSVGMTNPQMVNQSAADQDWATILRNNPPVASFVAKSPAHAAASQDYLGTLAAVAQQAGHDYMEPIRSAWHQSLEDARENNRRAFAPTPFDAITAPLQQAKTIWDAAGTVFSFLPIAPATMPVGREAAALGLRVPHVTIDLKHPDSSLWDPSQYTVNVDMMNRQQSGEAAGQILTGLAGLAVGSRLGRRGPAEQPAPGERTPPPPPGGGPSAPEAMARQPFHTGTEWNTTPDGFLADEEGNPVAFNSPRDAAIWRQSNRGDQVFEPDLHSEGIGLRDTTARPEDPYWAARRSREPVPGADPQTDEMLKDNAQRNADITEQMEKTVADSPLHTQAPELMREFLNETDAAGKEVSINPDVIYDLYKTGDIYAPGERPFANFLDDIEEAKFRGTDFRIPLADYLTEVAGKSWAEKVRAASTFTDSGISLDEASELGKDTHVSPGDTSASLTYEAPEGGTTAKVSKGEAYVGADRLGNDLRVTQSYAPETMRGQGIGMAMYERLAKEATSKGGKLLSDSEVSPDAQRMYQGLARRGYKVTKNPEAIPSAEGEGADLITKDKSPVYTVEARPVDIPSDIPKQYHEALRSLAAAIDGEIDQILQERSLGDACA